MCSVVLCVGVCGGVCGGGLYMCVCDLVDSLHAAVHMCDVLGVH